MPRLKISTFKPTVAEPLKTDDKPSIYRVVGKFVREKSGYITVPGAYVGLERCVEAVNIVSAKYNLDFSLSGDVQKKFGSKISVLVHAKDFLDQRIYNLIPCSSSCQVVSRVVKILDEELIMRGLIHKGLLTELPKKLLGPKNEDYADTLNAKIMRIALVAILNCIYHVSVWNTKTGIPQIFIGNLFMGTLFEFTSCEQVIAVHILYNLTVILNYLSG